MLAEIFDAFLESILLLRHQRYSHVRFNLAIQTDCAISRMLGRKIETNADVKSSEKNRLKILLQSV